MQRSPRMLTHLILFAAIAAVVFAVLASVPAPSGAAAPSDGAPGATPGAPLLVVPCGTTIELAPIRRSYTAPSKYTLYEAGLSVQGYGSVRLSEYWPYPDSADKVFALLSTDTVMTSLFVHDTPPTLYMLTMYVTAAPCSEHPESVWVYNTTGISGRPFSPFVGQEK